MKYLKDKKGYYSDCQNVVFFYILVLRLVLCAMERALTWVCKGCQMSVEETVECTAQTCFSLMYTTSRVQDLEEMLCRTILGLLFM